MWPFERQRHESCSKKHAELQDRVRVLEGQLQNLSADFEDRYEKLYDRLSRVYARLTKRGVRDEDEPGGNGNGAARGEAEPLAPFRPQPASTAHLAHRFRGF